jgi:hypothetical protein
MVGGRVVSFVVRLMRVEGGEEANVARYDTAHGTPHRDVIGKRAGLLSKAWYIDAGLDSVLREAVEDLRRNYEDYIRTYFQN